MTMKRFALSTVAIACLGAVAPAFADDATVSIKNGGLKITQGESSFQFGGRFMFDYDRFDGVNNQTNNGATGSNSEIRRGRIFVKSQFNKEWVAKLQINVDDKGRKDMFEDAYLKYKGFGAGDVTFGKYKEPFGLEELTSSKYISTIERSMMTDAFSPGRSYGVSLSGERGRLTYAGGVFSLSQDSEANQTYAFTGRITIAPIMNDDNLLHFGLSTSTRNYSGSSYQIKERAEVHTAVDKPATSALTNAEKVNLVGVEAAWVHGPYSLQTEYQSASVNAIPAESDAKYNGYYLLGSYFLTGESRPYSKGSFGHVKPKNSDGAWELVARLSNVNTEDNGAGVTTKNFTLGVNYYANANVRFMLNYISTTVAGQSVTALTDGNAVSLRAQYTF